MPRNDVSKKNPYWISKYRFLELKYFCLQYQEMMREVTYISSLESVMLAPSGSGPKDSSVEAAVLRRESLIFKTTVIETAARLTDEALQYDILNGVTTGRSYEQLNARNKIPCGRELYYKLYRKFFWVLDQLLRKA